MKKILLPILSLLFLFSSCTTALTKLSNKAGNAYAFLKTKTSALFEEKIDEERLVITSAEFFGENEDEFVPLQDNEIQDKIIAHSIPQPKDTPGAEGSSVPSIQSFSKPGLAVKNLFKTIHFHTDGYSPIGQTAKTDLQKLARYLKQHPHVRVVIEGHCDKRASEKYNLALGTKRAGAIRTMLVNYGAKPNQLYAISYGKERPVARANTKTAYAKNRRVQFKLYDGRKR
ncbi:OmpA family protein [bacterium]|nr:OmpA family protein [bacterium]